MVFPSVEFAIFFPVVLALSWALMPRPHAWKPFIVVASYAFYAAANWKFCLLLGGITLVSQAGAVLVHRTEDERIRRRIVAATVAIDLGVLGVFKYYGFFVDEVNGTLDYVGLGLPLPVAAIALPVGVSFFTFQAITYVVDVHRRLVPPASLIDAAVYLSFFPHLVAGPIVRASEFLPQLAKPRDPSRVALGTGIALIAIGLVKKVAVADTLAREVVDPVFAVPESYAAPDVILAAYAYTAQIYCDFSGYTDMAIGLALLLGFVFPQNFNRPYRSRSFREFWRRWHMTLSRFLRDYLYIPLGGSRHGAWNTARNIMITMLLGGLWHGASFTFVLWGGLHGAYLVVERVLRGRLSLPGWLKWAIVFHGVVLAWILFRSPDFEIAQTFFSRLVDPGPATLWTVPVVGLVLAVIGAQLLPERVGPALRARFEALSPAALGAGLAVVIVVVAATIPSQGVPPFIYFRFYVRAMEQPIVPATAPRRSVRDTLIAVGLATAILLFVGGGSIRSAGDEMRPGLLRDFVLAVGEPAGWVTDRLPFDEAVRDVTAFLSPDENLGVGGGRFSGPRVAAGTGIPPVSAEAFDRAALGEAPAPTKRLRTLLVTGDSLSMPLDANLARDLADDGVKTHREAHVGTGLSKSELLDWGKLSVRQVRRRKPDAVVVFIGANEGFDMTTAAGRRETCCGLDWAVEYATRARSMMSVYRRNGAAQVYWLTVPTPRGERSVVSRAVNEALAVAAAPYRSDVHVVDLVTTFTPGDRYRDAMTVGDRRRVVRESDGIHLNELGSQIAAGIVLEALRRDFVVKR